MKNELFIILSVTDNSEPILFSMPKYAGCLMRFPAKIGLVIIFFSSRKLTIAFLPNGASSLKVNGNENHDGFDFLSATGRPKT